MYCKDKHAGQIGSKGRRKALKDNSGKDEMDYDGDYVNPLTAH